ncbi:ATP-dependent helicase HrpB [Teredinibacter waterburyi]|uniref:ATP-dependent helicase HrpB n=1 Tax=Teredinibacter waterburyi TaxID=1500538 RepID=UPI00165F0AD8|nr:ATP-dependent helicase HrpB [Teredinibacter waterburyi]
MNLPNLPISTLLPAIVEALNKQHELVLEAAPGAGKTTLVPLALMNCSWLCGRKIIVLEPRRVAARAAAERMASLLNEPVGKRVGYRIRLEKKVSENTIVEVVTEGILTRWLQDDPELSNVAAIIFDEFHERSIHSDLGLALCLQARELFRDAQNPLKLLVMSATLDGVGVAELLDRARLDAREPSASAMPATLVLKSEGRSFPVAMHYGAARKFDENIQQRIVKTALQALVEQVGSILLFLPGQGEINRCIAAMSGQVDASVALLPLHGGLSMAQQQQAIKPLDKTAPATRKIVFATDIAETSLTIEGITVVIDSGLTRKPEFDPRTGLTRLKTQRISRASSIQRAGRAGRLAAGVCYRLWSEEQQAQLTQFSSPEILQADLAPLLLQLLQWGISNPSELLWLNTPPAAAVAQALELLKLLGIVISSGDHDRLSDHGELVAQMPVHPRIGHMLLKSMSCGQAQLGTWVAALLAERNPIQGFAADLLPSVEVLAGRRHCDKAYQHWCTRTRQQAKNYLQQLPKQLDITADEVRFASNGNDIDEQALAYILACAYPDRIARQRDNNRTLYQLSNGRSAKLGDRDGLTSSRWLVVTEVGGAVGQTDDRIFSAVRLAEETFAQVMQAWVTEDVVVHWNDERLVAETHKRVGSIILERKPLGAISDQQRQQALLGYIQKQGLNILPWTKKLRQWRARVNLLRNYCLSDDQPWPDLSDESLTANLESWLLPYLNQVKNKSDLQGLDLHSILQGLLPWPLPQKLDELAPTNITVPSGSSYSLDYDRFPPVLEVKLQEMFGAKTTPTIAQGKVKILIHLLSPARRPLQVTQDLEGFWNGSYAEVKKEMKGRYPKHPWPDNPWEATATRFTKQRLLKEALPKDNK